MTSLAPLDRPHDRLELVLHHPEWYRIVSGCRVSDNTRKDFHLHTPANIKYPWWSWGWMPCPWLRPPDVIEVQALQPGSAYLQRHEPQDEHNVQWGRHPGIMKHEAHITKMMQNRWSLRGHCKRGSEKRRTWPFGLSQIFPYPNRNSNLP